MTFLFRLYVCGVVAGFLVAAPTMVMTIVQLWGMKPSPGDNAPLDQKLFGAGLLLGTWIVRSLGWPVFLPLEISILLRRTLREFNANPLKPVMATLSDGYLPVVEALVWLDQEPHEHGAFVVVTDVKTKRFVQFAKNLETGIIFDVGYQDIPAMETIRNVENPGTGASLAIAVLEVDFKSKKDAKIKISRGVTRHDGE